MAVLEKIRSKGLLLIIIIGGALFLFIIDSFLNSSGSWFRQSKENIAVINGERVKIQEYQEAVDQLTNVYKIEYGIPSVDENANQQIRQTVWESMVKDNLIAAETSEIGMSVTANELKDLTIGDHPSQLVVGRRAFANPSTGQFDKNRFLGFLSQLENKPSDPQALEEYTKAKSYWMYFENLIKTSKLEEKYDVLLSKALNANSIEAKLSFDSKKNVVDVLYLTKPYYSVPDSKVSVSDKELEAKYEQIKERFKQKNETRDVKYVTFNLIPSQQDFSKTLDWMTKLKPEFSTATEVASVVNSNSMKPYKDVALSSKEIDEDLRSFAFTGKKNDVLGPVLFGQTYKMARIIETGISAPDSIKIKHIVVASETEEKTKTLTDSIMGALKSGADFASLAMKYSQMQQTAQKGGEVGWVPVNSVEPKLASSCLSAPLNEYFIYKDGKALQIIEVTEKTANRSKVKLAVIEGVVDPSKETYGKIYNEAKQFAASSTTTESFVTNAKKKGYIVQPADGLDANSPGLGMGTGTRQVIHWAFSEDVSSGNVSDVYECEKTFVVATLSAINPKGYKSFEAAKAEVKQIVMNDKKAEVLISELKSKNAADVTTLAGQLALKVDTAKQINFDSRTFGLAGNEPEVIVDATMLPKGKMSAPIKGKQGVYVLQSLNVVSNFAPYDPKTEKQNISMRYMYSVYTCVDALKDKANIEDNRAKFY